MRTGLAVLLVVATVLTAQGPTQDLEARLEAKLAQPFVRNAAWVLDYGKALEESKRSGKLVFAYFTRSFEP